MMMLELKDLAILAISTVFAIITSLDTITLVLFEIKRREKISEKRRVQ
jgi:hypothetical protein